MAARRRPWVSQLRWVMHEHGLRVIWSVLFDDLMAGGVHWLMALRISRRRARLAVALFLGLEQTEAAARLGVSLRTVASDARALRRVISAATDESWAAPPVDRIPVTPAEVPVERRSRRR